MELDEQYHRDMASRENLANCPPAAVHRVRTRVGDGGQLTIDASSFEPGDDVELIVLPQKLSVMASQILEMAMRASNPHAFRWEDVDVPLAPVAFEDLAVLFALSPLNRGIVRLDFDEAAAIFKAIASLEHPSGVEVGRFNGGSTFLLAVSAGSDGKLLSIDNAPQQDVELMEAFRRADLADRVTLMTADAETVQTDEPFDFAFIDGDHSYDSARRDHNQWGARVKGGGLIIHHDMSKGRQFATQLQELARLREDILQDQRGVLELVLETGSVAIFRRTNQPWIDVPGHRSS